MKIENRKNYAAASPVSAALADLDDRIFKRSRPVKHKIALGGVLKRVFDIFVVLLSLPVILPLIIGVSMLVKAKMGGPIFYGHKRVGLGGAHFRCWKFRSMVVNGDKVLADYLAKNPQERELWITQRKLRRDPRITPLGAVLRKLSIDELPQLFNILMGEMSIVGPRPVVDDELKTYGVSAKHYLRTRPGLTGLWQVSGRSNTTYQYRIALDRLYVSQWSILLDIAIVVRTIPAVLMSRGAM